MTNQDGGDCLADRVDAAIADGGITPADAQRIAAEFPQLAESVVGWIREAAAIQNWRRVERFANLAAPLGAPGLGDVLQDLLVGNFAELNKEDIVEILGEIRAVDAAGSIFSLIERSIVPDAPAFWLCQKAIFALGDLETDEARQYLHLLTTDAWPNPIRWHAAVTLQVEDDLGFDEDCMLE